jgi:hypothetical protein
VDPWGSPPLLRRRELIRRYRYVDFAARRRPGFRNCVIALSRVPELVERYGTYGCYSTFYLFDRELLRYARDHRRDGHLSVAGYEGPILAPVWPLDVDHAVLGEALRWARAIHERLTEDWGVPRAALRAYFSGKKGFHITVDTRAFTANAPSRFLPEVLHRMTLRLAIETGAGGAGPLDLSLRDRVRLLRLPNTRHEASGLFKVPLAEDELFGLDPARIRDLALGPRPLSGADPAGLLLDAEVKVSARARAVFDSCASGVGAPGWEGAGPVSEPEARDLPPTEVLKCPARRRLLELPVPPGRRNNTAIRLASWLREGRVDREAVEAMLLAWNSRNPEPLDPAEVRHVVTSAFAPRRAYRYGCRDPLIEAHCPAEPTERIDCPYHRGRWTPGGSR